MEEAYKILIPKVREFICELVSVRNGFLDENFYAHETIRQNLVIKHVPDGENEFRLSARLDEEYEYNLFNNLFNEEYLSTFYHYTSFETLFKIIESGKIRLSSLTGLNDKSEIDLVNNYMGRKSDNPYNYITMFNHNVNFVFCCSEKEDHLNQWRLYGNNGEGVMLKFQIDLTHNPYRNILTSRITYDLKLFEVIKRWLATFKSDLNIGFGLYQVDYWKFFFKNEDYADESEIRLLIQNTVGLDHHTFQDQFCLNKNNIIAPYIEVDCFPARSTFITLSEIILGPRFKEPDINVTQIQYMINKLHEHSRPRIKKSKITHYR